MSRWLALIILVIGLILFFSFNLDEYFSFTVLKQHREALLIWVNTHYSLAVISFMLIYMLAVAFSIPVATFLTIVSGFLFGIWWGTLYVVISATIGSLIIFLAVRLAFEPWLRKKTYKWIDKMRKGFQKGAFHYLLILRLIPLFPFWVVNIVSALLGVRTSIFVLATAIGILPAAFIYVLLGSGLGKILDANQTPNIFIIFEPAFLIPLILLAILSFLPFLYKIAK